MNDAEKIRIQRSLLVEISRNLVKGRIADVGIACRDAATQSSTVVPLSEMLKKVLEL